MSITTDPETNLGFLRGFLDDEDGSDFSDAYLTRLLTSANNNIVPTSTRLDDGIVYFAAYLGWRILAGKAARNASKRKILSVITKDTYVTYLAAKDMADTYLLLAQRSGYSGSISVQVPELDETDLYLRESDENFVPPARRIRHGEEEIW